MKRLAVLALVAAMAVALPGCGRTESYRYKLTLAVDTPDGVKRASSVVEALFWEISIPDRGITHKLRGEALYLDLGPGARPLIALLTSYLHPQHAETDSGMRKAIRWTRDGGPGANILSELYGHSSPDFMDNVASIAHMRGPLKIIPAELPDLVTFADTDDPKSVMLVDPNDLQATLGANITWHEITLEITDERVTRKIETKLTWLPAYFDKNLRLDGSDHGIKSDLANRLSWFEFDQSGDLQRGR
jgi:hypothetical protein